MQFFEVVSLTEENSTCIFEQWFVAAPEYGVHHKYLVA